MLTRPLRATTPSTSPAPAVSRYGAERAEPPAADCADVRKRTRPGAVGCVEVSRGGGRVHKVTAIYWTLGDRDGVLILEARDDETVTTLLLHSGAMGNVHTTTVRAFTAAEMDTILAKVHG